jgi:hypothetical protein
MKSLREKRLEFRTKHRKRCLRDRIFRFQNKSVQTIENNNCVPIRKKPIIVVLYER